jgi:hypothetical protein
MLVRFRRVSNNPVLGQVRFCWASSIMLSSFVDKSLFRMVLI